MLNTTRRRKRSGPAPPSHPNVYVCVYGAERKEKKTTKEEDKDDDGLRRERVSQRSVHRRPAGGG